MIGCVILFVMNNISDLPEVPNSLAWLATILAIFIPLLTSCLFLWRWRLSDWWAKRAQNSAKKRAEYLVHEFNEAYHLAEDGYDRRFQAISAFVLSNLIIGGVCLLLGSIIFISLDAPKYVVYYLSGLIFILGCILVVNGLDNRQRFIIPFLNWDEYFEKSLNRISNLLAKAGLDDDQQGEFIDNVIDKVESEITGDTNGEDDANDE